MSRKRKYLIALVVLIAVVSIASVTYAITTGGASNSITCFGRVLQP